MFNSVKNINTQNTNVPKKIARKSRTSNDITFNNANIFGKGFARAAKNDGSIVTKLLSIGALSFNGKIEQSMLQYLDKKLVWLYIRYIWKSNYQNPEFNEEFSNMASKDFASAANAQGFLQHVHEFLGNTSQVTLDDAIGFTLENLVDYINDIVTRHREHLEIPLLDNLIKLVIEKVGEGSYVNDTIVNTNTNMNIGTLPVNVKFLDDANQSYNNTTNIVSHIADNRLTVSIKV